MKVFLGDNAQMDVRLPTGHKITVPLKGADIVYRSRPKSVFRPVDHNGNITLEVDASDRPGDLSLAQACLNDDVLCGYIQSVREALDVRGDYPSLTILELAKIAGVALEDRRKELGD